MLDFNRIFVSKEEYYFFLTLNSQERIDYMFGLYDSYISTGGNMIDLSEFFKSIKTTLESEDIDLQVRDASKNADRIDVLIDEDTMMVESNSLRAIKYIVNQFMGAGYLLQRDIETEKLFKKNKHTKYIRVFYIIDQISCICLN